ncbi:hypothetical protein AAJCM20276_04690 [Acetobacter aceti]|uniref:Uncharacterized protein n=1 Tax=Acetobacter aceti TaxID=435 RepID=A0A6S6PGT3_ACEAC|nr:hypothetical protein AAJCM20276_04690 [Acetobacter aceti]
MGGERNVGFKLSPLEKPTIPSGLYSDMMIGNTKVRQLKKGKENISGLQP